MYKGLGAVNRVDDPLVFRIGALDPEFLADDAETRSLLRPEFAGEFFRTLVGNRYGRVVLFPFHAHAGQEILQDIRLREFRRLERDLQKFLVVGSHITPPPSTFSRA